MSFFLRLLFVPRLMSGECRSPSARGWMNLLGGPRAEFYCRGPFRPLSTSCPLRILYVPFHLRDCIVCSTDSGLYTAAAVYTPIKHLHLCWINTTSPDAFRLIWLKTYLLRYMHHVCTIWTKIRTKDEGIMQDPPQLILYESLGLRGSCPLTEPCFGLICMLLTQDEERSVEISHFFSLVFIYSFKNNIGRIFNIKMLVWW